MAAGGQPRDVEVQYNDVMISRCWLGGGQMAALVRGRRCPPSETPLHHAWADEAVFPRHAPDHALHKDRFIRHNLTSPCYSIYVSDTGHDTLNESTIAL